VKLLVVTLCRCDINRRYQNDNKKTASVQQTGVYVRGSPGKRITSAQTWRDTIEAGENSLRPFKERVLTAVADE
jgi:hypothetical protein